MKRLTKKSLIITTTIAIILAMVVTLYTNTIRLNLFYLLVTISLLYLSHLYIDKRLDKYAREISKFDRYYDFGHIGEEFEDVGKIYRNVLNKNIKLEKNISILKRRLEGIKNITSTMKEGFID